MNTDERDGKHCRSSHVHRSSFAALTDLFTTSGPLASLSIISPNAVHMDRTTLVSAFDDDEDSIARNVRSDRDVELPLYFGSRIANWFL